MPFWTPFCNWLLFRLSEFSPPPPPSEAHICLWKRLGYRVHHIRLGIPTYKFCKATVMNTQRVKFCLTHGGSARLWWRITPFIPAWEGQLLATTTFRLEYTPFSCQKKKQTWKLFFVKLNEVKGSTDCPDGQGLGAIMHWSGPSSWFDSIPQWSLNKGFCLTL